jgi:biotin carboxyl carrier protein
MSKTVIINGEKVILDDLKKSPGQVTFCLNNQEYCFSIYYKNKHLLILKDTNSKLYHFQIGNNPSDSLLYNNHFFSCSTKKQRSSHKPAAAQTQLTAPLPGRVIAINVKIGDSIKEGDVIAVIEAMKMEHRLCANQTGILKTLHIAMGDTIPEGFLIGEINES